MNDAAGPPRPPCPKCESDVVVPVARPNHPEGDSWLCCECSHEWPMQPAAERMALMLLARAPRGEA